MRFSAARSRKAKLENEPRILADLANALSLRTANEAIAVASERHARIPEYLARIVLADLLMRFKEDHQTPRKRTWRAPEHDVVPLCLQSQA
jgi:hypothetical protein